MRALLYLLFLACLGLILMGMDLFGWQTSKFLGSLISLRRDM